MLKQNAQHGTKWKPSHGRRARLHRSDWEETARQKAFFWKHFQGGVSFQSLPRLYRRGRSRLCAGPSRLKAERSERGSRAPRRLQTCLVRESRSAPLRRRRRRRVNTAVSLKRSRRNGNTLSQLAADPFKSTPRRGWPAGSSAVRDESLRISAERSGAT